MFIMTWVAACILGSGWMEARMPAGRAAVLSESEEHKVSFVSFSVILTWVSAVVVCSFLSATAVHSWTSWLGNLIFSSSSSSEEELEDEFEDVGVDEI